MKSLLLSLSYIKKVKWLVVALSIMMTFSILFGIFVMGQIQYLNSSFQIISNTSLNPENIYYYQELLSTADIISGSYMYRDNSLRLMELLDKHPAIEKTYTIKIINPLSYNDYGISILLYEPEILTLFPTLSQLGIQFSAPTSCVLGSRLFNNIGIGDSINLTFKIPIEHKESFTVSGRLSYPYQYMIYELSSTHITTDGFFQSGHIIIMQENNETEALFTEIADMRSGTNFFFTFSNEVTPAQIEDVLSILAPYGIITPLSEILSRSEPALREAYLKHIPMPLFLLIVCYFSYFSTLMLIFKKKEHHLAIYHLGGCSKKKCISIILQTFSIIALIPISISSIVVLSIPYLDWIGMIDLSGYIIDSRCLLVIAISFLVTQLIAFVVTWSQFRNHTPLSLLRGTQK